MFVGRTAAFIIHCKGMFELLVHSRANINMDLLYIYVGLIIIQLMIVIL